MIVRRVARSALVALLLFLMAVTPLSALISPGQFELQFAEIDAISGHRLTVTLDDRTGLVRGIAPAQPGSESVTTANRGRTLIFAWGHGCGAYHTHLVFSRTDSGFLIRERTEDSGCAFLVLITHGIAIHLWAPVGAGSVRVDSTLAAPR